MFHLGMPEVVLILVIGLFLFGNRLPEIARSLGKTLVDFKKEVQGVKDDLDLRQ